MLFPTRDQVIGRNDRFLNFYVSYLLEMLKEEGDTTCNLDDSVDDDLKANWKILR